MFVLLNCANREIILIGEYDTIDEARIAMHEDIILAMNETDCDIDWIEEVILTVKGRQSDNDFFYHDEEMEICGYAAWGNLRGNFYDWKIFEI